jgi:hypothetical protein
MGFASLRENFTQTSREVHAGGGRARQIPHALRILKEKASRKESVMPIAISFAIDLAAGHFTPRRVSGSSRSTSSCVVGISRPLPMRSYFCALVLAVAAVPAAQANVITFSYPVAADSPLGRDHFILDGFDPSMGILNSATILVSTRLELLIRSWDVGIDFPIAVPYVFTVDQGLELRNPDTGRIVAKQTGPATYSLSGSHLAARAIDTVFEYAFTFNATSDANGFAAVHSVVDPGPFSPPGAASGALEDFAFVRERVFGLAGSTIEWSVTGLNGDPRFIADFLSFRSTGTIGVTYDYTPTAAVPEPGSLSLLVLGGLLMLARHGASKRAAMA